MKNVVLGIDLGGTNLRLGLVDRNNNVLCSKKVYTSEVFVDNSNPTEAICRCIRRFCNENISEDGLPDAVSIGFPSTVSKNHRTVLSTPNIRCIPDNYHVVEEMEKELGIPVFANRDVNNLLLYDINEQNLSDCDCIVFIYFGTGLGNAVMLDGKIISGKNGVAMELGHIPVIGTNRQCGCGNDGCLETVCSGLVLTEIQKQFFPNVHISKLFSECSADPRMQRFVDEMSQVVAIEVNLFDPDCIVLGGGLLQMEGFPVELLEKGIHSHSRKPFPEQSIDIRYSSLSQFNGVIGSALYAFKRLDDERYI